jgi:hypothetical protein
MVVGPVISQWLVLSAIWVAVALWASGSLLIAAVGPPLILSIFAIIIRAGLIVARAIDATAAELEDPE